MAQREDALSVLGNAFANGQVKLTYKEIGIRLGVSTASAHNYINGTTNIPKEKFVKLCRVLKVDIPKTYKLYFGEDLPGIYKGGNCSHWQPVGIQVQFFRQDELEEIKKIITFTTAEEQKYSKALGIYGPKGSGKTTLAEYLLTDLEKDIDGSTMLSLSNVGSEDIDDNKLLDYLEYIASYFNIRVENWNSVRGVQEEFSRQLQSKKCVIVLDDVRERVPLKKLTFGGPNVWFIVLAESSEVFDTSIVADRVIELKPIAKDFGEFLEQASALVIDLETSLRRRGGSNESTDAWQPPEGWDRWKESEKLQTLIDTHFQQFSEVTRKCYVALGVWLESKDVHIFEPVFSSVEAHALWKTIQAPDWTEHDTKAELSKLRATSLITGSEEHDMYRIHPLILDDVMRRWEQQSKSDKEAASKWYMNIASGIDISRKKSMVPIIFMFGLVAMVEIAFFRNIHIGALYLATMAFLTTTINLTILWQKMTIPELWQSLRTIINLWVTPVSKSAVYDEVKKHTDIYMNIKRNGYLQQVQSFSRNINVLGIWMIVMILAATSIRIAMPWVSDAVTLLAILLSYAVINLMAYAMTRQVLLHRVLTTDLTESNSY